MRTKFSGILTLILALVVQLTFAQQKTITGTVQDDHGLPLPGANVIIKGTSTGTQSDFDGNFSISASQGQTLTFSYVGFDTQEVAVGAKNTMNISLVPGSSLETVVVTGYSVRNKTTSTSAVVTISAEDINQMAPTTSVDNLLQGKAAGVAVTAANGKPGQGAFVRIRGTGSLVAGASSPLYIVDGAPIREQDLGNISNADIENIEILKDAAKTARYGSRGANGVVIITTKSGNRNAEAVVRFSSRYGVSSKIKSNFRNMNASEKMQYEAEMFALGISAAGTLPGVKTMPGSSERQFLLDHETDWEKLILKEGITQNNGVSISGGAERVDYYFSVNNDRDTGIIDNINGFERTSSRLNVNFDAKDWLKIGVNVGFARSTSDEPRDRNNNQNPFRGVYDYNHYETEFILDADGEQVLDANGNPIYNPTSAEFPIRGALLSEPAIEIKNTTLASVNTQVQLSKNFMYNFEFGVNHLAQRNESYSKPGGILQGLLGDGGNKLDQQRHRTNMTASNRLNYTLQNDNHNFNLMGLYEYNMNEFNYLMARSKGFPSAELSTQFNAAQVTAGSTQRSRLTLLSFGAFADYSYQDKYLVTATVRRDGSSNFGKDNRFGTFYSGSLGWNIAEEDFFDVDEINDFTLRASYGSVGNRSGIGNYDSQGTVAFGSYPGGSATLPGSAPATFESPDLKWETTYTTNLGVQFGMFNKRLNIVADYFIRDTKDLLFNIPRPVEAGVGSIAGNLGEIRNKGFELAIQGDIVRTKDFTWSLGGNILFLDHKITSLPDGADIEAPNTFGILWREGAKINEHYYVRYAGVDPATGKSLYLGADDNTYFAEDLPEGDNRVLQGKSTVADKEGGFFTNLNYKGFGLRGDFVFKAGNYVNNFVRSQRVSDGQNIKANQTVDAFNYWKEPGDNAMYPSPMYASEDQKIDSDRFLEKGDYVRLRNVTLSYTFPNKTLEGTFLSSLRVYAQGQNLLTFSKFWGDPEVGLSSSETISFADAVAPGEATLYSYPNTKAFQVGVDVSF